MADSNGPVGTYRFVRRAGRDDKTIVVIQERRFLFFWRDCYPIDNATRSLEHEAIELYDRLEQIIHTEHKQALEWVKKTREKAEVDCARNGRGTPFKYNLGAPEAEMPELSERFKEVKKALTQGKARRGGPRTSYQLKQHEHLHDLKKLGEDYDHTMTFREPQKPPSNRKKQTHHHKNVKGDDRS